MQFTSQGIEIGTLIFIHYYGIILMLGAVAGGALAAREAKRRGFDTDLVWDLLIWLILGGVIGARLWHILTPTPSAIEAGRTTYFYLTHPLDAISIWNGGLGIEGAVAGGLLVLYIFTRQNKLNFGEWMDICAPALALGQAIGRWGNFFNQELYGLPTNLPWKLYIAPEFRLQGYQNVEYYHPLFLYESLLNLLNVGFLLWVSRRFSDRLKKGDVFLLYLVIYPTIRFFLEFLRLDPSYIAGININQAIAAVVAVASLGFLIWRHRSDAEEQTVFQTSGLSVSSGGAVSAKTGVKAPAGTAREGKPVRSASKKATTGKTAAKKSSSRKRTDKD